MDLTGVFFIWPVHDNRPEQMTLKLPIRLFLKIPFVFLSDFTEVKTLDAVFTAIVDPQGGLVLEFQYYDKITLKTWFILFQRFPAMLSTKLKSLKTLPGHHLPSATLTDGTLHF